MVCLLTPVVIRLVLPAVHFLRAGIIFPVVAALCLLPLLMVRRPWVARTVQVALLALIGSVRSEEANVFHLRSQLFS